MYLIDGTHCLQNATTYAIDRSVWVITAFDSVPIANALPDLPLVPTETQPHDTMVSCAWVESQW
jgi:hypothetical protein